MLKGTNLQYAKSYNIRIVLETIRLHAPVSRVDVAKKTNLTAQTVTNITRELMQAGLIVEAERHQDGRGAPSILLRINRYGAYSIGMDLDKDHLTAILIDLMGDIRQSVNMKLNFPTADEAMILFEKTALELIRAEGIPMSRVWGIGVGLPGPLGIDESNTVTKVVNPKLMPGWINVPVGKKLSERLNLPVYLENNASAAAMGERWFGAGRSIDTFFYVYFGAGLGGGIVINGELHSGFSGNAGELGYMPNLQPDSKTASDQQHLGLYFNLPLLYKKLNEHGKEVSSPDQLEPLFYQSHPVLMDWIEQGAQQITPLILAVEYIIDPEVIFFGGRLPDVIIRNLLERIQSKLPHLHIHEKKNQPRLLPATSGFEAAALGVAILPLYTKIATIPNVLMKSRESKILR
jgi:predicted NBD/HSP70 family sugar kinase